MKKFFAMLAAAILVLLPAWGTQAQVAPHEYVIADLRVSATMPYYYDVFTRSMDENSALLEKYGVDAGQMKQSMLDGSIYIDAINTQTGNHLLISGYSDEASEALWSMSASSSASYAEEAEKAQASLQPGEEISIRSRGGTDFWYYRANKNGQDIAQYTIVENGKYIQFTASATDRLQQADLDGLDEVVDTVYVTEFIGQPTNGQAEGMFSANNMVLWITVIIAVFVTFRIFRRVKKVRGSVAPKAPPPPPMGEGEDELSPEGRAKLNMGAYKFHHIKIPTRERNRDGRGD